MSNEHNNHQETYPDEATPPPLPPQQPQRRRRKGGFFRSLISHLLFAAIAVIGVGSYIHWDMILAKTGAKVCNYNVLGKYAKPAKTAPAATTPENQTPARITPENENKTSGKSPDTAKTGKSEANVASPASRADTGKGNTALVDGKQAGRTATAPGPDYALALEKARKLFWGKDKKATSAYEALAASHPGNPALIGELGNVYYMNNQHNKAAGAYLRAGKLYIAKKQHDKARELVKVLKQIAPQKASELAALLAAAN